MLTSRRFSPVAFPFFTRILLAILLAFLISPTFGKEDKGKASKKPSPQTPTPQAAASDADLAGPFVSRLEKLDLSSGQRKKIEEIRKSVAKKVDYFRSDKISLPGPERRKKIEAALTDAKQKALEVLGPKQRRKFYELWKNKGNAEKAKKKEPKVDLVAIFRPSHPKTGDGELLRLLSQTPPPQPGPETNASGQRIIFPFEQAEKNIPRSKLDRLVLKKLKENDIEPSPLCSDQVFVRRVYLDMLGVLPTPLETLTFLQDQRPSKRVQLIDSLFERPEFADYWAMKWCDVLRVKAEFPINLWPNGAAAYHRWIREAIQENMPYDEFARVILTSSGSNFRDPPINFYRATQQRDAKSLAEVAALTFMGTRLGDWPKGRRDEVELFFTRVGYKKTDEWKEEIVYWDPKPLERFEATMPDGTHVKIAEDQDPRQAFADWLITPENPWFARAMANRVWYWLMGRGIVHLPDDFRDDNPPSNPELLDYLGKQLSSTNYDLRRLFRLILNSRTYQRSSISHSENSQAEALFAYYPMRPMDAEVLQDAFCQIFNVEVGYSSEIPEPFTYVPKRRSTVSLADGSISSSFLQLFGRPTRDTGLSSERELALTRAQRMFFINSTHLNNWIARSRTLRALSSPFHDSKRRPVAVQLAWLAILSRYPTPAEMAQVNQLVESSPKKYDTLQDVLWTLVNTKEFWCRH